MCWFGEDELYAFSFSDIYKALFISSLFFLRRKLRTLLIFSAFFIYIYALSIQNFPLQLLWAREVF